MRPRADEVMQSIISTYDEHILPNVQGEYPRSLALTVSNLLRHVLLRMEREGPALVADNAELRETLAAIARYIAALDAAPERLRRLQNELETAAKPPPAREYAGLNDLVAEAYPLRTALNTALEALQEQRGSLGGSRDYQLVRDRIRVYLDNQIKRESLWIREAYTIERR